jgi:hypothetical protein
MNSFRLFAIASVSLGFWTLPTWAQEPTAEAVPVASVTPEVAAPLMEVVIPPGRPAWVESAASRNGTIHQTAVKSEPFVRRAECERELDKKIAAAVNDYITEQTGSQYAPTLIAFDLDTLKRRLVNASHRYEETIVSPSVGEMHQVHALVQFPEDFRDEIARRWLQVRSASRLGQVGLGFAAVLSLIGTVFGFFRADNATRGYYTGRLQFVAGAAVLVVFVVGLYFARAIPWI